MLEVGQPHSPLEDAIALPSGRDVRDAAGRDGVETDKEEDILGAAEGNEIRPDQVVEGSIAPRSAGWLERAGEAS